MEVRTNQQPTTTNYYSSDLMGPGDYVTGPKTKQESKAKRLSETTEQVTMDFQYPRCSDNIISDNVISGF